MKIGAFGEVMLRFSPPEYFMLEQTDTLKYSFTGTGVNILANLSKFGMSSTILTALPNNRVGEVAQANLQKLGIDTQYIHKDGNHIGQFFAEIGYGLRPTEVTYLNRLNSAFGQSSVDQYAISSFVAAVDYLHICGISISLTENTRKSALEMAKEAHRQEKKICFDFNYRASLNDKDYEEVRGYYEEILPYSSIVFGGVRDLTDILGMEINKNLPENEQFPALVERFLRKYQLTAFAGTKRIQNGSKQLVGTLATLVDGEFHYYESNAYDLTILDRIGAGDAFAAGIIWGMMENISPEYCVEFATVNAVIAHTINGDTPLTTIEQVKRTMEQPNLELIR
ncbi:MAG: sugar kinase [Lactobacillales bacterium]|jgi:2-dehydro-3-deoxygluconokinase|nr:sugar kinase [Lactobacillales bacterium]